MEQLPQCYESTVEQKLNDTITQGALIIKKDDDVTLVHMWVKHSVKTGDHEIGILSNEAPSQQQLT